MKVTLYGGPFDGRLTDVEAGATELRVPHLLMHGDGTAPDLAGIVVYRLVDGRWRYQA